MTQYERSGVVIDQCTECKGLFLDRGEFERLAEAERNWNSGRRDDRYDDRYREGHDREQAYDRHYDSRHHEDRNYGDRHHGDHRRGFTPQKRRRGSFFEDLLDFD